MKFSGVKKVQTGRMDAASALHVLPADVAPSRLGNPRPRSLLAARAALPSHT